MAQETEQRDEPQEQPRDPIQRLAAGLKASLPQRLLVSELAPPGKPRPYEPRVTVLSEARSALHLRALNDIVRERFGFPTPEHRDFKTYANVPQRTMGVAMPDGAVAYPDIVVVQDPENYAKILGEVETAETVSDNTARYRWLPFARLAPLYLYVPVGSGDDAHRLAKEFGVELVGIRTWRYSTGVEQIEINDHFTVPSGPEEMLPKILRPG